MNLKFILVNVLESYKNKKNILVTGGSGQVGLALSSIALNLNFNFLFPTSKELDLSNKNNIIEYCNECKPDLIINLGAYTNVNNAENEKNIAKKINADALDYLGQYSNSYKTGLIHFSTDYVFGNNGGPFHPESKTSPMNFYGLSKKLGEDNLLKLNSNALIIRLASVFSENGNNFVKTITDSILENKNIKVISDQSISLTYAGDVSNFILRLIKVYFEKKDFSNFNSNIIHFTNSGYTTWFKVAEYIHNEIKNYNIKTTSVLESILAKDWGASVIRSNDTRLNIENDWIKANGMIIPDWETRVSDVVKNILSSRELI